MNSLIVAEFKSIIKDLKYKKLKLSLHSSLRGIGLIKELKHLIHQNS